MKKTLLVSLLSLACSMSFPGISMAQRVSGDIVESTDPARAAEVERHAEEIRGQQGRPPAPAPEDHPMKKKHHHKKHHGKGPHEESRRP